MPNSSIHFFCEDVDFKLKNQKKTISWIKGAIQKEGKTIGELNFIFCSDKYLLEMNIEYLQHNTYTDIITFDTSEEEEIIGGDIFVSIDRVQENAIKFEKKPDDELHRVIIHGVLHLIGYSDKSAKKKIIMRGKEDAYLSLR
jgi:probable rRNA maturation factor